MLFKFVAGNKVKDVLKKGKFFLKNDTIPIINYISENKSNKRDENFQEYKNLISKINNKYMVALKLSSLDFNKNYIYKISDLCREKNIKLIIDAENNKNIENYRKMTNNLIYYYNRDNLNIVKTYQMYRKDSILELYDDIKNYSYRNIFFSAKLVRGAYWYEDKNTDALYRSKYESDNNYNLGILKCYESKYDEHIIASHNELSIRLAKKLGSNNNKFIICNLLGMNENFMKDLNHKKGIYLPYGPYTEMIPYLIRRLYENYDQIKYFY